MKISNIAEVLVTNVFENEFKDENKQTVKWYYANILLDDEMVRMKVNSKKVDELLNVPKRQWVTIEYVTTHKLISEDGTKYETTFEYVGLVPFTDDIEKTKKGDK